jgi:hypothetical protein
MRGRALAKRVRQSGKSPVPHANIEVLPLDVRRADVPLIRVSGDPMLMPPLSSIIQFELGLGGLLSAVRQLLSVSISRRSCPAS